MTLVMKTLNFFEGFQSVYLEHIKSSTSPFYVHESGSFFPESVNDRKKWRFQKVAKENISFMNFYSSFLIPRREGERSQRFDWSSSSVMVRRISIWLMPVDAFMNIHGGSYAELRFWLHQRWHGGGVQEWKREKLFDRHARIETIRLFPDHDFLVYACSAADSWYSLRSKRVFVWGPPLINEKSINGRTAGNSEER